MNWSLKPYKHYSAEHLHKADKARLATENLMERERLPKKARNKSYPRNRK